MAGETSKTNKLSAKLLFNINAISNNFIQTISISCRDLITAICRKQFEEIIGLRSVILCSFGLFDCYSAYWSSKREVQSFRGTSLKIRIIIIISVLLGLSHTRKIDITIRMLWLISVA